MTSAVRQLLISFEALPVPEQHQATVEILRRVAVEAEGDVPADCLLELADELFRGMDGEEASHATS